MRVDELQDEIGSVNVCPDSLWPIFRLAFFWAPFAPMWTPSRRVLRAISCCSALFAPCFLTRRFFQALLAKSEWQREHDRLYWCTFLSSARCLCFFGLFFCSAFSPFFPPRLPPRGADRLCAFADRVGKLER